MSRSPLASGAGPTSGPPPEVVRVFVSYSHDSPAHVLRVFRFAEQLRDDGIDCELDQYEEAPPEGWPAWMANQVRQAKYVLVVCTAAYHRRVLGTEAAGVGLGARWEGALITQDLYERGGRNDKFIPVVFDTADLEEIPDFLRHTTHYDLSNMDRREKLYRRLTDQPEVTRRPLGPIRQLPTPSGRPSDETSPPRTQAEEAPHSATKAGHQAHAAHGASSEKEPLLALIGEPLGQQFFIPLVSAEVRGNETTAVLQPDGGQERAFLESLGTRRYMPPAVDFVFGTTAMRAQLQSVVRTFEGGTDRFTLVLGPDAQSQGNLMEVAVNGTSAKEIARLRARRILLNEPLADSLGRSLHAAGNDSTLEMYVRGLQSQLQVEQSPLPALARRLSVENQAYFLAAAKLTAILWLRLSGTVAHVLELEMKFRGNDALAVKFRGARARVYNNQAPEVIAVEGLCLLG